MTSGATDPEFEDDYTPGEDGEDEVGHEVGYGRPPANRQFGAGPGANPRYRGQKPREKPNQITTVRQVLSEGHKIKHRGQTRRKTFLELMLLTATEMATSGNIKAFNLLQKYAGHTAESLDPDTPRAVFFQNEELTPDEWREIYDPNFKAPENSTLRKYKGEPE